jgi:hypothetical protein
MRLLPIALILAACLLVVSEPWSQAGPCEAPKPGFRHVLSMHFENRDTAPLHFEVELDRKNGPRTILTNLHSAPLTAYVEQIMPVPSQQPQHIGAGFRVVDALLRSGLLSPVPRGLSVIGSVEHIIGEPYPQVTLVAAVWEDGSTYGLDELVQRVLTARRASLEELQHAILLLQTGLKQGWIQQQYLTAVKTRKDEPCVASKSSEQARRVCLEARVVYDTITLNLQRDANDDPASLEKLVKQVLEILVQRRDTLRASLPALPNPPAEIAANCIE